MPKVNPEDLVDETVEEEVDQDIEEVEDQDAEDVESEEDIPEEDETEEDEEETEEDDIDISDEGISGEDFPNTVFAFEYFDDIDFIRDALGVTIKEAKRIRNIVMTGAKYELYFNGEVKTPMGTLYITEVAERSGVSKMTGKEVPWTKPAHDKTKFKESKSYGEFINNYEGPEDEVEEEEDTEE